MCKGMLTLMRSQQINSLAPSSSSQQNNNNNNNNNNNPTINPNSTAPPSQVELQLRAYAWRVVLCRSLEPSSCVVLCCLCPMSWDVVCVRRVCPCMYVICMSLCVCVCVCMCSVRANQQN